MGPAIILIEPQLGENIGTSARAMANFGLNDLRIVNPRDGWPNEKAVRSAANASELVEQAKLFSHLEEAISDLNFVAATTARPRDMIKEVVTPEMAVEDIRWRLGQGEKAGILFGREKSGLTNRQISFADQIIVAPVNPECASLNLAQAVLLLGYEWQKQRLKDNDNVTLGRKTQFDGPAEIGTCQQGRPPATRDQLVKLFEHLEKELENSGFLRNEKKKPHMMVNIRNMIHRMQASDQDVNTLRGIIAALVKSRQVEK